MICFAKSFRAGARRPVGEIRRARQSILIGLGIVSLGLSACSSGPAQPAGGGTGGPSPTGQGAGGAVSSGNDGAIPGSGGVGAGGARQGAGGTAISGAAGSGIGAGGTPVSGGSGGAAGSSVGGGAGSGGAAGPPTIDLFNGVDLTGFNTYRANSTANNSASTLLPAAEAQAVFKPENGMIHVYGDAPDQSTQVHYLLQTVGSYGKYNLSWEYKWGTKKFAPYTDLTQFPRDAGVLWHIHGDKTQVWPSSIEFQNKWGTTGDIFALYAQCVSLGAPGAPTQFAEAAAGGVNVTVNGSNGLIQHLRSANFETPGVGTGAATGVGSDWNTCLLHVDGGTAIYTVNGHVVNRISAVLDKTGKPVTSGPIAWQAEQAEVFYRNLRLQVLP